MNAAASAPMLKPAPRTVANPLIVAAGNMSHRSVGPYIIDKFAWQLLCSRPQRSCICVGNPIKVVIKPIQLIKFRVTNRS